MKNEKFFQIDHLAQGFKQRAIRGGALTLIEQGGILLIHIITLMVLVRILPQQDFGLIAMIVPLTTFIMLFNDLGLSTAVVQKKEITHDQVNGLFWINIFLSAVTA